MIGYERKGTFDDLNAALFAQIDRLQSAQGEEIEQEIARSNAVSKLATNVVNNMNNAVQVARILADEGMDVSGIRATMPRMLGAGE